MKHLHNMTKFIFLLLLVNSACTRTFNNTTVKNVTSSTISCVDSELMSFGLEKIDYTPNENSVNLGQEWKWNFVPPSKTNNIKLEICVDINSQKAPQLKRITWMDMQYSPLKISDEKSIISVKGLDEAIFGNNAKLEIKAKENDMTSGILIKGIVDNNKSFVIATPVKYLDNGFDFNSISLVYGKFANFDPFIPGICESSEVESINKFSLGSAQFTFNLCTFLGGGETTGYRITKVTVSDSNSLLATPISQTLEGENLQAALNYRYNHHNACDSFVLTLANAQYAATSAAMAGCGTAVEGAPKRTYDDENFKDSTLFTTKYESTPASEIQQKKCAHYLFSCN